MKRSPGLTATICFLLIFLYLPVAAQDEAVLEYDIVNRGGILTTWLDLSFILSPSNLKKLKDGIALALEYNLTLATPRRLWGSRTVTGNRDILNISYRQVTENYYTCLQSCDTACEHRFITLEKLKQYLKDSLYIGLVAIDSLDKHQHYLLEIKITSISLTTLNLLTRDEFSDSTRSTLKSLFKGFLDLTGYGRKEFSLKSRSFSLDEIYPVP
ncbi:MAG: DUF4390 domain-containing protein [candidate division Zixibacteria bacterium]|nr:DUF4390 domain-containing protein [candidate division Zixibacteria bacterium]